jgi:hypothetical protein
MRNIAFFCLTVFFFLSYSVHAQKTLGTEEPAKAAFTISGSLKDTTNFIPAGYTSISLIRSSDSLLQTFTRADEEGNFALKANAPGKYLLLISHPSFAIFVDEVEVTKERTELGTIIMTSKKQMLSEVVITDARAIVLKGDTIEYAADSFKTRQFDNVDELLKKLPGIEVDRNGKIKAYGKTVEKMTVDGEEFFSDDPAVVAQTLRASAVDKVQVFDKKSDQAAFTGVDDGELTKTINLKLKEDAKRGYFGKVSAGAGPPEFWENQAMINAFKKKRKVSAYGIMSNTNTNGLGWNDMSKYGGGGGFSMIEDDNGRSFSWNGDSDMDSWDGQFEGQGLPKTWTGGAHYSNKWMGDSLSLSASYKYGKNVIEGVNNSKTQYILPDTQYINTNSNTERSLNQNHGLSFSTEYLLDTSSSLKLTLNGKYRTSDRVSTNQSSSESMEGGLINDINSRQQNRTESKSTNANLLYRKRFSKKGRSFSANFSGSWSQSEGNGLLNSSYNLFALDSAYVINQRKRNTSKTVTGGATLSYTEPLSKVANLEVNYGLNINNNDADNSSFDRTGTGSENSDVFNPQFSSHYVFNTMQNQGGANLRFKFKKVNLSLGGTISDTRFKQEDRLFDTTYSYSYLNFFPKASFTFNKSQATSFRARYNGRTKQPTINQLQPLRNNNDPLNITIGNPSLKQEFSHSIGLNYHDYKVLNSRSVYGDVSLTIVQNAISQQQNVDISGRRTTQYVNVNGNYNVWGYMGYGKKILGVHAGLSGSVNYSHNNNFINGLPNVNNQFSVNPNLYLRYDKDTTIELSYQFYPAYNRNTSSIRTDVKTQYWTYGQRLNGSINLPYRITVGTDINWDIRQRLSEQDRNNNVFRWNAYVSRSFLKDRSLVAKVYANDILDQNVGYSRINNADYVAESTYNTIRRYFLFSLTWNFTKTGASAPASDGIIIAD